MGKIDDLLAEGCLAKISELEKERYVNFFRMSHKDNLEHAEANMKTFPRWSIISGYYAMHDATKLLLAKQFGLKVEYEVHATTIKALDQLIRNRELLRLMKEGYKEFLTLANDLAQARRERVKTQYYTGTAFSGKVFGRRAEEFLKSTVRPYLKKVLKLAGEYE